VDAACFPLFYAEMARAVLCFSAALRFAGSVSGMLIYEPLCFSKLFPVFVTQADFLDFPGCRFRQFLHKCHTRHGLEMGKPFP